MSDPKTRVTRLLLDWSRGNADALADLVPLICDELRIQARRYLSREAGGHTLETNDLVQEVLMHLHGRDSVAFKNRSQFFGVAAQAMRRILVDHARRRHRAKRGRGVRPVQLDQVGEISASTAASLDLPALSEALENLQKLDPRQAKIVDLRFFVGLTVEETSAALEISPATVKREWKLAKLWLYRELRGT